MLLGTAAPPRSLLGDDGVGAAVVVIRHDDDLGPGTRRDLFERTVDELGCDPADVMAVRISESGVEADVIDFEHPAWPVHTLRHGPLDVGRRRA